MRGGFGRSGRVRRGRGAAPAVRAHGELPRVPRRRTRAAAQGPLPGDTALQARSQPHSRAVGGRAQGRHGNRSLRQPLRPHARPGHDDLREGGLEGVDHPDVPRPRHGRREGPGGEELPRQGVAAADPHVARLPPRPAPVQGLVLVRHHPRRRADHAAHRQPAPQRDALLQGRGPRQRDRQDRPAVQARLGEDEVAGGRRRTRPEGRAHGIAAATGGRRARSARPRRRGCRAARSARPSRRPAALRLDLGVVVRRGDVRGRSERTAGQRRAPADGGVRSERIGPGDHPPRAARKSTIGHSSARAAARVRGAATRSARR